MPSNLQNSVTSVAHPCQAEIRPTTVVTVLKRKLLTRTSGALRWAPLWASLLLAACASLGTGTPQAQITQRATERWQALIALDFPRAYTYGTPSFRSVVPQDNYRIRFGAGVTWLGAEVVGVECPEATKCIAKLRIDYKPLLGRNTGDKYSSLVDETWLLDAGQWWIFESVKP